jgi:hypothetical protein
MVLRLLSRCRSTPTTSTPGQGARLSVITDAYGSQKRTGLPGAASMPLSPTTVSPSCHDEAGRLPGGHRPIHESRE